MRHLLIGAGAVLVLGLGAAVLWGGRAGPQDANDPARQKIVYVCTETGRTLQGPATAVPAVNAETGRRTMMPGLYCEQCRKWHATAPFEVTQRDPASRLCPRHRTPMRTEGPL